MKKENFLKISRIIIAIALIVYLFFFLELENIISSLKNVDLFLFSFALFLLLPNLFFQFLKWKYLLNSVLDFKDNNKILRSLLVGLSSGIITPMRVGEYYGRSLDLKNKTITEVATLTFIDKLFVLLTVIVVGGQFFVFFLSKFFQLNIFIQFIGSATLLLFLFVPFGIIHFKDSNMINRLKKINLANKLFLKTASLNKINNKIVLVTFVYSVIIYSIYTMQYAILISAFSINPDFHNNFLLSNVTMFSKAIIPQISFGELGVRESTSVFYSSYFNVLGAAAFNASVLIFVINLLIPSIAGFFFITKKSK